jgi:hypothetical protein
MVGAMRRDLLAASYLRADETPVRVQMLDRRGDLWQTKQEPQSQDDRSIRARYRARKGMENSSKRSADPQDHLLSESQAPVSPEGIDQVRIVWTDVLRDHVAKTT